MSITGIEAQIAMEARNERTEQHCEIKALNERTEQPESEAMTWRLTFFSMRMCKHPIICT